MYNNSISVEEGKKSKFYMEIREKQNYDFVATL